jgi:hypothetical protein
VKIHSDFSDFVAVLNKNQVEFLIVGAFALAFHGCPRATGDLDCWIRPKLQNAKAVIQALGEFGLEDLDLSEEDLLIGKIVQLGFPPVRIDLITHLDGLNADEIWASREIGKLGDNSVFYLGKEAFVKNKRALGRHKDLADLELLGEKV